MCVLIRLLYSNAQAAICGNSSGTDPVFPCIFACSDRAHEVLSSMDGQDFGSSRESLGDEAGGAPEPDYSAALVTQQAEFSQVRWPHTHASNKLKWGHHGGFLC